MTTNICVSHKDLTRKSNIRLCILSARKIQRLTQSDLVILKVVLGRFPTFVDCMRITSLQIRCFSCKQEHVFFQLLRGEMWCKSYWERIVRTLESNNTRRLQICQVGCAMNNKAMFLRGQGFKSRNPNQNELQGLYLNDLCLWNIDRSSILTHMEGRWRTDIPPLQWICARMRSNGAKRR